MSHRLALISALLLVAPFAPAPPAQAVSTDIVISQVYGGGGGTGAVYTNDYVELFNRGGSTVSLASMSVQYTSATGTGLFSGAVTTLTGSLAAGQRYLVSMASGGVTGAPLPTPDKTGTTAMSATMGKVALVDSTTGLPCNGSSTPCSTADLAKIRDLVGYGGANFFEGSGPAPTISTTLADLRKEGGCTDTDVNSADFTATTPAPHNTSSALTPCNPTDVAPTVTSTVPANGSTLAIDADLSVTFSEPVDVADPWFSLSCSTSGSVSAAVTGGPEVYGINPATNLADGESCTFTVLNAMVTDKDGTADTMAADYAISFTAYDPCTATFTTIPAIQGSGPNAAITGPVTTKGVVTLDAEGSAGLGGFYLQDPTGDADPATSDGIFVYTGLANTVAEGQVVRVSGFARERAEQTTLNGADSDSSAVTGIVICGTGSVTATDITLPFAQVTTPEQYEGMLVRFPQDLTIADYYDFDRYGEIILGLPLPGESRLFAGTQIETPGPAAEARTAANALRTITLDDRSTVQNPATLRHPNGDQFTLDNRFRGGDTVTNTVGVLGYGFGTYRVEPTGPAQYAAVNARPAVPSGGPVRVASLNAMNYFLNGGGISICGPTQTMLCRGWNTMGELPRQRAKLLAGLTGTDADIIAITELENTPDTDPLGDLLTDLPGYAAIDTGVIGTDAVRSGLLYRSDVVAPVGSFAVLDSSVDARFADQNRPTLAQTFRVIATGERFTVAVNHFRSRGTVCTDDADVGQGNCNLMRTDAAEALMDWLATDPTGSADPDVLIVGDLNAYTMEDPLAAVMTGADDTAATADDFTDLMDDPFDYTFLWDAALGSLDHALASSSLAAQVASAGIWHVNADEPDVLNYDTTFKPPAQQLLYAADAYRFADHDPILVGLDLTTPVTPPVEPPVTPPVTPPVEPPVLQKQTAAAAPARIKKRGVTVLVRKGARTSAGMTIRVTVSGKGKGKAYKVFRSHGAWKVRTFGAKGWRLVLTRTAAATTGYEAWREVTRYVNGKRR